MKRFWNWKNEISPETSEEERTLYLNGTIAEESWYDDDITPQIFKEELNAVNGNITVWINSPGGDCIAAAQIYNMLKDYKGGSITIKIDGIAASAASVIAMAGDKVCVSPVSMMMIHNPSTIAWGDMHEMQNTIDMLNEVKESIMNAYEIKTGLDRKKLCQLMDNQTWMNANKAIELGFADEIITRTENIGQPNVSMMYTPVTVVNCIKEKIAAQSKIPQKGQNERKVDELMERLESLKKTKEDKKL